MRDRLKELLGQFKVKHTAAAGIRLHSFAEGEAAVEAASEVGAPLVLMVSVDRDHLGAFSRALRGLRSADVYLQLVGGDPEVLARAADELKPDAVFLSAGTRDAAGVLCRRLGGGGALIEVLLPWRTVPPGGRPEGRIVDEGQAIEVLQLEGLDVAAIPVGGGPGPYKFWRVPIWSPEVFRRIVSLRQDMLYALPWGSLLPKELLRKYNLYGGALPGVISLPRQQLRAFIAAGAVKISFRSDPELAFWSGMRESLLRRPEAVDVRVHLGAARRELVAFLRGRLRELGP